MRTPILEAFYLICPWLNADANDTFLDGARQGFDGESVESIAGLAKAALSHDQITILRDWYDGYPELRSTAGVNFAIDNAVNEYLARERETLLGHLSLADFAGSNADLRVMYAYKAERERLRIEITGGQSIFSMRENGIAKRFDGETGQRITGYDSQGRPRTDSSENWFDTEDLNVIRQVHAQIMQERALRSGSVEEVRAAAGAKRKPDFSDSPFKTALNVQEKAKAQAQPKYSAPLPDTRPVSEMVSEGFKLINPNTFAEFTKPQLLQFLERKGAASEILVSRDTRTINSHAVARMREILQGKA